MTASSTGAADLRRHELLRSAARPAGQEPLSCRGGLRNFHGLRLSNLLLTTNNVVLETIAVARYEVSHGLAARAGHLLYGEKLARVHRTSAEEEAAGFAYLQKYDDKDYNAVDCPSFAAMEKLGIREALAFDSDFGHRFVMRPGAR